MMHAKTRVLLLAGSLYAAILVGCQSTTETRPTADAPTPAATDTSKQMVVTPFDVSQAKFAPLNPNEPDGPQISVLWGDYKTGPSASLFRFPKNYGGKLHIHSADYHLILLKGVMKHWAEGQSEATVPALDSGAYWFQPANQIHSDNCLTNDCIAFVKFEGPIDAVYKKDSADKK